MDCPSSRFDSWSPEENVGFTPFWWNSLLDSTWFSPKWIHKPFWTSPPWWRSWGCTLISTLLTTYWCPCRSEKIVIPPHPPQVNHRNDCWEWLIFWSTFLRCVKSSQIPVSKMKCIDCCDGSLCSIAISLNSSILPLQDSSCMFSTIRLRSCVLLLLGAKMVGCILYFWSACWQRVIPTRKKLVQICCTLMLGIGWTQHVWLLGLGRCLLYSIHVLCGPEALWIERHFQLHVHAST